MPKQQQCKVHCTKTMVIQEYKHFCNLKSNNTYGKYLIFKGKGLIMKKETKKLSDALPMLNLFFHDK